MRWIRSSFTRTALVAVFALLCIAGGTYVASAHFEENDGNCASCHSLPETTYVARAQASAPVDLASAHAALAQAHSGQSGARCIDCHSGPGLNGRVAAMSVGARDVVTWLAGSATQPARQSAPLPDQNCLKCHSAVLSAAGFDNHMHRFLTRWQTADPTAASCASCHTSHTTDGSAPIKFLNQDRATTECKRCHVALGVGE